MRFHLENVPSVWRHWRAPIIGAGGGLVYGIVSQQVDFEAAHAPKIFIWLSNFVSVVLEGVLWAAAGLAYNYLRRQQRLNRLLSAENSKLKRHLLTQTLSAHILHEIRNPLHNLHAILEEQRLPLAPETTTTLTRNLSRLYAVTTQLSRWTALDDELELCEPVLFGPWLQQFIVDTLQAQLRHANIDFQQSVDHVVVKMHPLLLEQCFSPLFNNAMEAIVRGRGPFFIRVIAKMSDQRPGFVNVHLLNGGEPYPDAILAAQGREPIDSQHGLGLGLVLVRKSVELVEGSIELANTDGQASTHLWIPGSAA